MAGHVLSVVQSFFRWDGLGRGRPCLALSCALHLPLLQITNQSRKCDRCDEPLIAGGSGNFFGVEEPALTIAFDLSFGSRHSGVGEPITDLVHSQSVTELVVVLLWPARAGHVIHLASVASRRA